MLKKSFFNTQRTSLCALFKGESIEKFIAQARSAEFAGADAIAIELNLTPPELRTKDNFARLMSEVRLPFMFLVYRNDAFIGGDDEARQPYLLAAAEAGAEVIDVMGDLFDPSPFELTRDPGAVKKQMALIDRIHERGAKVIMSSHTPEFRTAEQVLEHMQVQASRGADMVKLVTGINSEDELQEAIRTTMLLNRELKVPFIHLGTGSHSRLHRFMGMHLGVAVEFGVADYSADALFSQPTLQAMRLVRDSIHWDINNCN